MDPTFETLLARYRAGAWTARDNRLQAVVTPPGELPRLPEHGSAARYDLAKIGRVALEGGQVGALILAGGMATRFRYDQPKGIYPILDGKSFLELKVRWIRDQSPEMPIYVMTSFHTHEAIRRHLEARDYFGCDPDRLQLFQQGQFPRITSDGALFRSPGGQEDHATPGHGDFVEAMRLQGLLASFLASGGRFLLFSNVDNLGASVEPAILGWHLRHGHEMTVEVAAKRPGDKGGAPACVGGRVQLVEGFAFPDGFDQDRIPVFNTATYVFSAEALMRDLSLPWYLVEKDVNGVAVIQFERLAGDLSGQLNTGYVEVERDDRFIPVKSQAEVPTAQQLIRQKQASLACA